MKRVGLLLLNTSWGRSNLAAADAYFSQTKGISSVGTQWFSVGEQTLAEKYRHLREAGAEAILLVANEGEGALLVREIAELPAADRLPVISHWGVTGGNFVAQIKQARAEALEQVDFRVVQTFSFLLAKPDALERIATSMRRLYGTERLEQIDSPIGFAHAYDLTHILARAINVAGTTERPLVRDALEKVADYAGLVRHFAQPVTAKRHEALTSQDIFLARYRSDGALMPDETTRVVRN